MSNLGQDVLNLETPFFIKSYQEIAVQEIANGFLNPVSLIGLNFNQCRSVVARFLSVTYAFESLLWANKAKGTLGGITAGNTRASIWSYYNVAISCDH